MKVRVRIVRAIDDVEATEKYIFGHHKVLESYGITKVTSADRSWALNPHVYLILFESMDDQRILGVEEFSLEQKISPYHLNWPSKILIQRLKIIFLSLKIWKWLNIVAYGTAER